VPAQLPVVWTLTLPSEPEEPILISCAAGTLVQSIDLPSVLSWRTIVGVPFTWRRDRVSVRLRLYHQNSHVGDEILLLNPGFERVNLSFEEPEGVAAYDLGGNRARVYAGGGLLLKRHPAMKRPRLLCGIEWHGRRRRLFSGQQRRLEITPVLSAELKAFGELDWKPNLRVVGGVELARERGERGVRILAEYYHGSFPYGQFFEQKVDHFGVGVHLAF
jgi:hypothetical protein